MLAALCSMAGSAPRGSPAGLGVADVGIVLLPPLTWGGDTGDNLPPAADRIDRIDQNERTDSAVCRMDRPVLPVEPVDSGSAAALE